MLEIEQKLPVLPLELRNEILEKGIHKSIPAGTEILRKGQFVAVVPLVLEGSIKVLSSYEDRDLLLYYIEPAESCVMSFSAALWHLPSKIFAIAVEDTEAMLLPVELLPQWINAYPELRDLFYRQFNKRYEDMIHTIHHVLFDKLDKRLYDYLAKKSNILNSNPFSIRHHEIAQELGTAREVVSRVLKKLEVEGKVKLSYHQIQIL